MGGVGIYISSCFLFKVLIPTMMDLNQQNSDYDYTKQQSTSYLNQTLYGRARLQFVRKVYSILTLQLLITVGMTIASMYSQPYSNFQMQSQWLIYVTASLMLISEIAILCCKFGRRPPTNYILLLVFTISQGYLVSLICSAVGQQDGKEIVLMAAIMTLAIVVACTFYALVTKEDFTIKWGLLAVLIMAMLMLAVFSLFRWSDFLYCLYCTLGVIVFGIYLIIDTQLIIGGKRIALTIDEYVAGAMLLYIDIIQIFLRVLSLLSKFKK